MQKRSFAVILGLMAFSAQSFAQDSFEECGATPTEAEAAQVLQLHRAGAYSLPRGATDEFVYVPLTLHVLRNSQGLGGISESQLWQAVADTQAVYEQAGIRICVPGEIDYIDDSYLFNNMNTQANIDALRRINPVPGTVNVYFTPSLSRNGSNLCGVASYSSSMTQGVVIMNACAGTPQNPSTVPHEIGHYFDLFHTHERVYGTECSDGSNCDFGGDLICDTPADPNLEGDVNNLCQYSGYAVPTCGTMPYNPDINNLMSYSRKTCRTNLTPGQIARVRATLFNIRPDHVRQLRADVSGDGIVSFPDLNIVINEYGRQGSSLRGDVNGDGIVTFPDLNEVLTNYGSTCY